jgi:hypothetical protein
LRAAARGLVFTANTSRTAPLELDSYSGALLTAEFATIHIRLPGHEYAATNGKLTMTDPFHGSFVDGATHFDFSCDPRDAMTGASHPAAPQTPARGTAIITRALYGHVHVVDGVECSLSAGRLRVTRTDGTACSSFGARSRRRASLPSRSTPARRPTASSSPARSERTERSATYRRSAHLTQLIPGCTDRP